MGDPSKNRIYTQNHSGLLHPSSTEASTGAPSEAKFVQEHLVYFLGVPIIGFIIVAFFTFIVFIGVRRYRASAPRNVPVYRFVHQEPDSDWDDLIEEIPDPHFVSESNRPMIRASLNIRRDP